MISKILTLAPEFLSPIALIYEHRFKEYGPKPEGVFWNGKSGYELRLSILARLFAHEEGSGVTVNDLGCGYGAFFNHIKNSPYMTEGRYVGYDISKELVESAATYTDDPRAVFAVSLIATGWADYSFACGTFNLKDTLKEGDWTEYVKASVTHLWSKTRKGMAFNLLSQRTKKYLDGLYYADTEDIAAFCAERLSSDVEVIDDYALEEFTVFVRR